MANNGFALVFGSNNDDNKQKLIVSVDADGIVAAFRKYIENDMTHSNVEDMRSQVKYWDEMKEKELGQ